LPASPGSGGKFGNNLSSSSTGIISGEGSSPGFSGTNPVVGSGLGSSSALGVEPLPPLHPHSNTNTEESINISSILRPFIIALVLAVQVAQVTPTGIRQSFYWSYKQHKIRAGIPRRNSLRRIYRSSPDKSKTGFAA
jgi:hypothetical protein